MERGMFYDPSEHSVGIRQIATGWLICGFLLAGIFGLADHHRGDASSLAPQAAAAPHGGVTGAAGVPC
jgi:hypothetical protein